MRFYIETLGCKVNQYESAAISRLLQARGHTPVSRGEVCDAVIINSCTVTGDASRQSRQTARRLLREHPGALLAVCGCASQTEPETMAALGASLIGGSGEREEFAVRLEALAAQHNPAAQTIVGDPKTRRVIEPLPAGMVEERARAMLKIQDGCDNFCSYCIIPHARGRVRSLPPEKIAREAETLAAQGFREIVLTGIEICSYGKDLDDKPGLYDAITAAAQAAPGARFRLGSLEPSVITAEFIEKLRKIPHLCGHFHLSLQSGSDSVLARMRRKYTTAGFFGVVTRLREAFPNCGITADLIMGFPGETEQELYETLHFLEKCAFSGLHVFPYSKRPGTLAAAMPDQLKSSEKKERAALARAVGERTKRAFIESQLGRTLEVLIERDGAGHSDNYLEITVKNGGKLPRGEIVRTKITSFDADKTYGEAVV